MWIIASRRRILGLDDRTREFALANLISNIGLQIESLRVGGEWFCQQWRRSSSILVAMTDQVDAFVLDGRRRCRLSRNGDRRRRGMSGRDGGSSSSSCTSAFFGSGNEALTELDENFADGSA